MKFTKSKRYNILFFIILAILIIPQSRKPIQVALHSVLAQFEPSVVEPRNRQALSFEAWELHDLDGVALNFIDLEGEVIFINFWATWCPPCIAELPSVSELYYDYKDKIRFVLVSTENRNTVNKFFTKKGYDLNSYQPITDYPEDFDIRSIPHTFLIDKEGNVVVNKKGAANWNSKKIRNQIDQLLK